MDWFLEHLASNLFGIALGGVLGLGPHLWKKFGSRQIWRMDDPKSLILCVSLSAMAKSLEYEFPATGVGQVRALGVIAPPLARAYRGVNFQNILFHHQLSEHDKTADLIVLGGPHTNELTKEIFAKWRETVPVRFEGSRLYVETDSETFTADPVKAGSDVTKDVGVIVWTNNPFNRSKRLIVLAGSHTYGTIAAAMFLVDHYARPRLLPREGFIHAVSADVHRGEVEPPRSLHDPWPLASPVD